jgi:hypothetical protein
MARPPGGHGRPQTDVNASDRAALRRALLAAAPWLDDPDRGPRTVSAGSCDRCGQLPRLVPTCGPGPWEGLCRPCALQVGLAAWCQGHREEGRETLRWAVALPPSWDVAVALWWVATGELRDIEPRALSRLGELPARVRSVVDEADPAPPDEIG